MTSASISGLGLRNLAEVRGARRVLSSASRRVVALLLARSFATWLSGSLRSPKTIALGGADLLAGGDDVAVLQSAAPVAPWP